MERTFIDSGAFIALLTPGDNNHRAANHTRARLAAARTLLVTTNHVVDETCTWLLWHGRNGHASAVRFGNTIQKADSALGVGHFPQGPFSTGLVVVYCTPEIEQSARDIFVKHDTAGFSFTDCVSFAVMQALGYQEGVYV